MIDLICVFVSGTADIAPYSEIMLKKIIYCYNNHLLHETQLIVNKNDKCKKS